MVQKRARPILYFSPAKPKMRPDQDKQYQAIEARPYFRVCHFIAGVLYI